MPARSILIVGESSSGKSTSVETLSPEETFIVNVVSKDLPFRGWKKNYTVFSASNPKGHLYNGDNAAEIIKVMTHVSKNMPEIKYLVVDDCQYVMANEYMRRSKESGFGKFAEIGKNMFDLVSVPRSLRDDLTIFFTFHAEEGTDLNQNRRLKAKTIGKMVDNVITLEGLFSIVLYATKEESKQGTNYLFITNGDPLTTAKSPKGMFETKIPNSLKYVVEKIHEYENAD